MGADGHRFSPNSPSPLLPCLPGFFVPTFPPPHPRCLPPEPTTLGPIAGISTVLHLEERGLRAVRVLDTKQQPPTLERLPSAIV